MNQEKVTYAFYIEVIRKKIKKSINRGFTLVELLVVVGILSVLLAIVLIAINPFEQLNKTSDIANQVVIKDFASATKYFYTEEKTTPWVKNSTCRNELANQDTISQMPTCVEELTKGGDLQEKAINSDEAKDIYMTECSNSISLCYKPKSSAYKNASNAKYQRNGVLNPNCPDDENCYICEFSTNEAQECFEIMSPNTEVIAAAPLGSQNEAMPVVERPSVKVCGDPDITEVACMSDVVTDSAGNQLTTLSVPKGLSPEQIHKAYNLPCTPGGPVDWQCTTPTTFGPETIAIVGAFHNPTIESDLAVYNATFGLPPCTKANGCLTVVNQNGQTSPLPSGQSSEWAAEAALDVQSAHAVCQTCKILLVETDSNTWINMGTGTQKAAGMGATVVSNSYGNNEVNNYHTQFDLFYEDHLGVAITASSGDWGHGSFYPAANKNVIGVGGTELYLFQDNTYASEKVWGGTGSGCALNQSAGLHQTSLSNWSQVGCGNKKAIADVSAVASPNTGAAIYISGGWRIYGGTSLSSPIYAATVALQGGIPSGSDGAAFPYTQKNKFRDVTIGSNGGCGGTSICIAGIGYDGPTGLGTPNLIPQGVVTPTVFPTSAPPPSPTPTPRNTITSSDPSFGYLVGNDHHAFTKVSGFINASSSAAICSMGETSYCTLPLRWADSGNTGYVCNINNTRHAVFRTLYCDGEILESAPPSPTPTPTATVAYGSFIVNTNNKTYTRVTNYALSSDNFYKPCVVGETITCSNTPILVNSDSIGQCEIGNTGYAVWSKVSCNGIVSNTTPTPTPTPTLIPTATQNCNTQQTVTLAQSQPILALPGDTVNNTLTIKNNNSIGCGSLLYTISSGRPSGWTLEGIPASVTVTAGETKSLNLTIQVPSNTNAGNYPYQFWVAKPGESSPLNTDGSVQVAQVGPTNTPTPTPINCFQGWSNSLGSTSLSGNAGDTLNQTLTITYNNPASCGTAVFGISHGYPSGWIIQDLPPSVTLTGGQSITIPFKIVISTGAQVQDYTLQYWVNSGGQPMNATVHVLNAATAPEEQMFSNFNAKMYGSYALFEYSYNAVGNVSGRLDVSTDPNGLNTTSSPPPTGTRYGFAFNSGSAMDASNQANPNSIRGFINSSPQSWTGWQCGATIYYRMYNSGDMRIKSPVKSAVVDCTTQISVLPWSPWYAAIYQGVYDNRYDADANGVINYVDYWILVRATRLR